MTIRSQSLFLFTKELILATKRGGDIRQWCGMDSIFRNCCLIQNVSNLPILPQATSLTNFCTYMTFAHKKCYSTLSNHGVQHDRSQLKFSLVQRAHSFEGHNVVVKRFYARNVGDPSFELKTENDVLKFSFGMPDFKSGASTNAKNIKVKRVKMSKKRKLNELRFYRLKAKKKMKSPNPEVRIRYKLEKAKRKEAWLIEKLMKFEVPKAPSETYDPEILTEEEKFYLKRTGEKKKHYVPLGRRGVFGGVVLNMHLHWKKHETVKVVCKPCKPGQVHEYAEELARLSEGVLIDIKPNNTIIFYRGKNYVQPEVMSPPDTLSKNKALEKYKFEQSLEHTSEFIEKLEKELDEYHKHLAQYRKRKEDTQASVVNTC